MPIYLITFVGFDSQGAKITQRQEIHLVPVFKDSLKCADDWYGEIMDSTLAKTKTFNARVAHVSIKSMTLLP